MAKELYKKIDDERIEEIQDIIEKIPTSFGSKTLIMILIILSVLLLLAFKINYPQVVVGNVTISAENQPIRLVANTSGKIKLLISESGAFVSEGQYIAYIENSASIEDVVKIKKILTRIRGKVSAVNEYKKLPVDGSLGDLNTAFFSFLDACDKLVHHYADNLFLKQKENYSQSIKSQKGQEQVLNRKLEMSKSRMTLIHKFFKRDSLLLAKKVISESEFDRMKMEYINFEDQIQSGLKDVNQIGEQINNTISKIEQNVIQRSDKENELRLNFISTFKELEDKITEWEQKYIFKSSMPGKVQFSKFISDNHFITLGEPLMTILPLHQKVVGQMILPAAGAGKVKIGQQIIIKLDNYPYMEFGSIKGTVQSISLISDQQKLNNVLVDSYLVMISLPYGLMTNYGEVLDFKYEIKGTGDVIIKDKVLAYRLFDNMKYLVKEK